MGADNKNRAQTTKVNVEYKRFIYLFIYSVIVTEDGNKLCGRPPEYARPYKLTFDLLTLKVVSESRVTWATSVPILVFLGVFVLDLDPIVYATD